MKPLGTEKQESKAPKSSVAEGRSAAEAIDFSKVMIEPTFEEMVDFDTFAKSDYRAVKILE